jgi:small-conductance mechanosensitive channel
MEALFAPERLAELWARVYEWLLTYVFVVDNTVQAAVIAVTFGVAMLVSRRVNSWLAPYKTHSHAGRAVRIVLPLVLPLVWLALLWLTISAATTLEQPYGLLNTAASLLAAWVAINLVSQFVKNPLWATVITWTAWSIAALNILNLLTPTIAILDSAALELGDFRISLYTVARATIALAVLLSIAMYFSGLLESRIRTSRALSPSVQVLFTKSLKAVLVGAAILVAIRSIGFDLTALAVLGGAIGLGAGFGLQKIVSNLVSGVMLLLDKSIKPGDVIAVAGTYGWVTALGGRYVSVVTRDGVEHLIPNELLISERVENWTHTNSQTRLKLDFGVHYRSDVKKVIGLCELAASETDRVLKNPEPKCLLIELGESALKFQLRFWIADAHNGVQNVKSAVLLNIWEKFKFHGIEVPYPQRDLHVRSSGELLGPLRAEAGERSAA